MKLVDFESKLQDLVKEDLEDPEIYNNLQKLCYYLLLRRKCCKTTKDAEDISFEIAGDIYLKLLNGDTFKYFIAYIDRIYKGYVLHFYQNNTKELLEFDPSLEYRQVVYGGSMNHEIAECINKVYLQDISKVISYILKKSCKYKENSPEYLNTKLSLVLSLYRGFPSIFHLNEEDLSFIKFLITDFNELIINDSINTLPEGVVSIERPAKY